LNRAAIVCASLLSGVAVAPTAACAQERLGFALHVGALVPHAGLTAFSPGSSYVLDGELPLNRTFAIGMLLGIEQPRGGPRLVAANTRLGGTSGRRAPPRRETRGRNMQ
jgi:hypothetical protein